MKIKLLFFGVLTDVVGQNNPELEQFTDLDSVKSYVKENYPKVMDYSHIVSVNREIVQENMPLKDGDEVAFLPPFTGG